MQTTTNYALKKPDGNDTYNVANDNDNMDAIDAQMKANADAAAAAQTTANAALPASSYTAADVLSKIKTVDGSGSGLDADTLDGHDSSYFLPTTGTAAAATKLATARTISLSGDASGSASFDGSTNEAIAVTLANAGTPGTYTKVTTDSKGRVTSGESLSSSDVTGALGYTPANPSSVPTKGANTYSDVQTAPAFAASGLPGATAGGRFVGTTASGAPTTASGFTPGDLVTTQDGNTYVLSTPYTSDQVTITPSNSSYESSLSNTDSFAQKFTVNKTITVTGITLSNTEGSQFGVSTSVALFDNSGNVLGGGWVTQNLIKGSQVFKLSSPVTLQPNTTYWIGYAPQTSNGSIDVQLGPGGGTLSYASNGVTITYSVGFNYVATGTQQFAGTGGYFNAVTILSMGLEFTYSEPETWFLQKEITTASGTWSPASGTMNVSVGTVINVAVVSKSAKILRAFTPSSEGYYQHYEGTTTDEGTAFTHARYTDYNYCGYSGGISIPSVTMYGGDSALAPAWVGDGAYGAEGYFQVHDGYLQFVVCGGVGGDTHTASTWYWGVS